MSVTSDDLKFLELCEAAKADSHDPIRQVGALIVESSGEIAAVGTNKPPEKFGFSMQESHEAISEDPFWKYYLLEHAERNAIFRAWEKGSQLFGSTMYASLYPCADCARAIAACGIRRLVVPAPGKDGPRDEKWQKHYYYATQVFRKAGIEVDVIPT